MATRPNRWYISLDQVKRDYLHWDDDNTDEDTRFKAYIRRASALIEKLTDRVFYPVTDTRYFDFQGTKQVILGDDLLSVTTFQYEDDTVASDEYFLYPLNRPPYLWVEVDYSVESMTYEDTRQKNVTITGDWGYCDDTEDTGADLAEDLDTSETAVDVDDASVVEVGWMLLVDSEQMFCSAVDTDNNRLTVSRAQGGTTAATHSNGADISRYVPPWPIEDLCGQIVARLADRSLQGWGDRAGTPESGYTYMKALPAEGKAIVRQYRRMVSEPARPLS